MRRCRGLPSHDLTHRKSNGKGSKIVQDEELRSALSEKIAAALFPFTDYTSTESSFERQ
jgi:hypothetical protein